MAHRNIKITRDIVQTCNRLGMFNKSNLCFLPSHKPAENACKNVMKSKFHHMMSNTENEYSDVIKKNSNIISPLPELMKELTHKGIIFNIKGLEVISNRNISNNSGLVTVARSYSSNSKNGEKPCKPVEKKCVRNQPCPKFVLPDCPPSKGSDCAHLYRDPHCTKKMAPYPSYSELCAYRMEDHPSECQQCPWQRCGDVEDMKPQKKQYHTSARVMNMAMIPVKNNSDLAPLLLQKQCDATKKPCKEPPPKCKTRDESKKEKCPEKKEEKKCSDEVLPKEAYVISGSMKNLDIQRFKFSKGQIERLKSEFGVPSNLAEEIVYDLKGCPKDETTEKCPKRTITPPVIDSTTDLQSEVRAGKHDKGHPPPCEEKKQPKEDYCPENVDKKKVYRRERDLNQPTYKKYPIPYNDPDPK